MSKPSDIVNLVRRQAQRCYKSYSNPADLQEEFAKVSDLLEDKYLLQQFIAQVVHSEVIYGRQKKATVNVPNSKDSVEVWVGDTTECNEVMDHARDAYLQSFRE